MCLVYGSFACDTASIYSLYSHSCNQRGLGTVLRLRRPILICTKQRRVHEGLLIFTEDPEPEPILLISPIIILVGSMIETSKRPRVTLQDVQNVDRNSKGQASESANGRAVSLLQRLHSQVKTFHRILKYLAIRIAGVGVRQTGFHEVLDTVVARRSRS